MSKVVRLGWVLVLLALASPAFPGPHGVPVPDPPPTDPTPLPYCWDANNTPCTNQWDTVSCTDGIYSDYLCVCRYNEFAGRNTWDCPITR
jgi:hypothetical protein